MELGEALNKFLGGLLFVWTYIRSMKVSLMRKLAKAGRVDGRKKSRSRKSVRALDHVRVYTYSMLRF